MYPPEVLTLSGCCPGHQRINTDHYLDRWPCLHQDLAKNSICLQQGSSCHESRHRRGVNLDMSCAWLPRSSEASGPLNQRPVLLSVHHLWCLRPRVSSLGSSQVCTLGMLESTLSWRRSDTRGAFETVRLATTAQRCYAKRRSVRRCQRDRVMTLGRALVCPIDSGRAATALCTHLEAVLPLAPTIACELLCVACFRRLDPGAGRCSRSLRAYEHPPYSELPNAGCRPG